MSRRNRQQQKPKTQIPFQFMRDMMQPQPTTTPMTLDEVRKRYGPPKTLGCSKDRCLAMDSALSDSGVYTLLQHTFELGMAMPPQFLGYGMLQGIAQNGLIRACVSTVSNDMTRSWIELQREGDALQGAEDSLLEELGTLMQKKRVKETFAEAIELAGYEGGSFIFIDTGEKDLTVPLSVSAKSAELQPNRTLRFVVVDPANCTPGNYNSLDPLKEDYFKPATWWVLGKEVHASRLLRIVWNEVPFLLKPAYNFFGVPQAQILWDYVMHFQQCRDAENRLLRKFSLAVFKTQMFNSLNQLMPEQTNILDSRIKYMIQHMNNDGCLVVDKENEDVVKIETPLSGVTDIVRQALEFLAAINRTPAVKLLGISPSGFNATGESDLRNYYDHVATRQQSIMAPALRVILDCLQLHLRGEIDPTLSFEFRKLSEEDKKVQAETRKMHADTAAVYLDRGVLSQEEVRQTLAANPDSGYANIDADDLPPVPDPLMRQETDPLQPGNIEEELHG